jgi:phenylacetate-CoA ligase
VFTEVENLSEPELRALQWERLTAFLRDHVAANAFHRPRLDAAGIDLAAVRSPRDFRHIPLMRKPDVVADIGAHPPFGTLADIAPRDVVQIVETTGTSGQGRELYPLSRADDDGLCEMEATGFHWAGVAPGRIVATSFPVTTRAAGRWHQAAVAHLGGIYLPLGTYPAAAKLEYLRRLPVEMLVATPSYLVRMERVAEEQGIDPATLGVGALMVAGESFTTAWAVQRERTWRARLYEQYGSTQRAFAWSCERGAVPGGERGVLHTLPHLAYYEVLDPDSGTLVEPGGSGELVITPFAASRAAPLLRFATGDRVTRLGPRACPCGRAFEGIRAGAVERLDDMMKVRGVNLFPSDLDPVILGPAVLDYAGTVDIDDGHRERLRVMVELRPGVTDGDDVLETIRRGLAEHTGLRFEVAEHRGEPLSGETREEMRKRRRWRDLRPSGRG